MAISKTGMKIAYSQLHAQYPEMKEGSSRLIVAEMDLSGGVPKIVKKQTVFESPDHSCTIEAQDFLTTTVK